MGRVRFGAELLRDAGAVVDADRETARFHWARLTRTVDTHARGFEVGFFVAKCELLALADLMAGRWRANPLRQILAVLLLLELSQVGHGAGAELGPDARTAPSSPPATPPALLAMVCSVLTAAPPARPASAIIPGAAA